MPKLVMFFVWLVATVESAVADEQILQIEKAWIKLAPPTASVNAAYLELHNPSSSVVIISQIAADCCGHVMLHETRIDGDQAAMHHLDELSVPAKSSIAMQPGGLHLMLMQIKTPLVIDAKVSFVLTYADGRQQQLVAVVKRDD
jgi:periplasmic copper chaperone A